jgi:hypothetical protein
VLKLTTENFAVVTVGLHCFEADVEISSRLDAFVAENPAHEFVVAAIVAQDNRRRSMPELMAGDADADIFFDRPGDSDAETVDGTLGLAALIPDDINDDYRADTGRLIKACCEVLSDDFQPKEIKDALTGLMYGYGGWLD